MLLEIQNFLETNFIPIFKAKKNFKEEELNFLLITFISYFEQVVEYLSCNGSFSDPIFKSLHIDVLIRILNLVNSFCFNLSKTTIV